MRTLAAATVLVVTCAVALPRSVVPASQSPSITGRLALIGATIHPGPAERQINNGVVLIEHDRIAAVGSAASVRIPPNTQTIDCSGLTITAGFWNSHVHFFERKWANAASLPAAELDRQLKAMVTSYGFTSVFDTGSMFENTRALRSRIENGEVPGPRIRTTGEALIAPGALPPDATMRALGYMVFPGPEVSDAAAATAAVTRLLDTGADGIKVHLQRPPQARPGLSPSAMQAAIDAAHAVGKIVFVHPTISADVVTAVRAGVDVIAHTTPSSGTWDDATIAAMTGRKVALTPTLSLWRQLLRHDRSSLQEQFVSTAVGQLRAWRRSGGTVLFGNDLGAVDYDPAEEYGLMADAGMTFTEILTSLTTAPAERFGAAAHLGRIAPGLIADLTVLKGDPSRNIRVLGQVQYTVRDGKLIYRAVR
jgi:imidazolonepropionase-like amidohydrolase